MKKQVKQVLSLLLGMSMCLALFSGCDKTPKEPAEHEPLTIVTANMKYEDLKAGLAERYPEIKLDITSYRGGNGTGYLQYTMENGDIPDIYTATYFSQYEKQKEYLLDLSGYEFLNNYKTVELNQTSLDGAVYLVPANLNIIGLYYNQTLFAEHGWETPKTLDDLKALSEEIKAAGLDPSAAHFELAGNGFFDLFTMAKTDFLSTPDGLQWERDFKAGKATAKEGLADAAASLQGLIDCGFLNPEDAGRTSTELWDHFTGRGAAMHLTAGIPPRLTQNSDGTGDQYGMMPFPGEGEDSSVVITLPIRYFGLSKKLAEPGNEQKLADALKVMEFLATPEGQKLLTSANGTFLSPLKNDEWGDNPLFAEVKDAIFSGHTSTLAYAGYESVIIDVGNKVRDWVAGKCTGDDVLALMDQLQQEALNNTLAPVAVAEKNFTLEETAQLQAEAFRKAAGADVGLVSLGAYYDGVENSSGVCMKLYQGDISQDIVNAVIPNMSKDPVCVLTLPGAELKALLETGFLQEKSPKAFPYVPAGIVVTKNADGTIKEIKMADGSAFDEKASYTVAVDDGAFTEEVGQKGNVQKTDQTVGEVVKEYFSANSPLSPLPPSIVKP